MGLITDDMIRIFSANNWGFFATDTQLFTHDHYRLFVVRKGPGQIENLSAVV